MHASVTIFFFFPLRLQISEVQTLRQVFSCSVIPHSAYVIPHNKEQRQMRKYEVCIRPLWSSGREVIASVVQLHPQAYCIYTGVRVRAQKYLRFAQGPPLL